MAWLVGGSSTLDPGRCGDISFRHAIKCNASCRFEYEICLLGSSMENGSCHVRPSHVRQVLLDTDLGRYPAVLASFRILWAWLVPSLQLKICCCVFLEGSMGFDR